ncbi:MAG: 4'-phosphopantetheinyl transferase superfamily protein [Phycisphaeraceae bacterium]|nr:4'-phosphopantetheinyl transferase superfamily protein [Phycisphaeraceae bacterium]
MNGLFANPLFWPNLPDNWQPQQETVDVFAIHLQHPPLSPQVALEHLSDHEQRQVSRFKSSVKQREFTLTRAMLRLILASVTHANPLALRFERTALGKPFLPQTPVHFNVSHSKDIALIAICPDLVLGVDIEQVQPRNSFLKLAQRFFAPAEFQAISQLPQPLQLTAFYSTWTRKEAFVKATAKGIALGLDRFEVNVDPSQPACFLKLPPEIKTAWSLHDLTPAPAPGYTASLCVEASMPDINCRQISHPQQLPSS